MYYRISSQATRANVATRHDPVKLGTLVPVSELERVEPADEGLGGSGEHNARGVPSRAATAATSKDLINVAARMGASSSAPAAQVRERHVRAMYINVPVDPSKLQAILLPPAVPHLYKGNAWVSVVLDDLFLLETPIASGFMTVPGMNGWMMKINALVQCTTTEGGEPLCGYQILSLDFEATAGPSSWVKKQGALSTQMIPTSLAHFTMSAGESGSTDTHVMKVGTTYTAEVCSTAAESSSGERRPLISAAGELAELSEEGQRFAEFVVGRPHKFLAQQISRGALEVVPAGGTDSADAPIRQLAFASWREGYDCTASGCMALTLDTLSLPVLNERLGALGLGTDDQKSRAVCFLQPEYSMVDVKNTIL